jgi:hypothetical protein
LQRFTGEDPIEFRRGGFNLYVYADNNAIRNKDPLGLYVGGVGAFGSGAIGAPSGQGAVGGGGFAGVVNDDKGNWGFAFCGALGPATGGGVFGGIGSINAWGSGSICDLAGNGYGLGYGGAGMGGGWGPGGFIEISAGAIASTFGYGFGGFAASGGFGGCIVIPVNTSCDKCKR